MYGQSMGQVEELPCECFVASDRLWWSALVSCKRAGIRRLRSPAAGRARAGGRARTSRDNLGFKHAMAMRIDQFLGRYFFLSTSALSSAKFDGDLSSRADFDKCRASPARAPSAAASSKPR